MLDLETACLGLELDCALDELSLFVLGVTCFVLVVGWLFLCTAFFAFDMFDFLERFEGFSSSLWVKKRYSATRNLLHRLLHHHQ